MDEVIEVRSQLSCSTKIEPFLHLLVIQNTLENLDISGYIISSPFLLLNIALFLYNFVPIMLNDPHVALTTTSTSIFYY